MRFRFIFFILLLSLSCSLVGQKKFFVTIELPKNCDLKELTVFLDDGKTQTFQKPSLKENKLTLNGIFYSEYAGIILRYPRKERLSYQGTFFVTEKPAIIKLLKCDSTRSPFESNRLQNVYDFARDKKGMNRYDSAAVKESQDYLFTYGNRIFSGEATDSSIANEFYKKDQEIYRRGLEYILQNGTSYYSFWYFRRNIARSNILPPDSILYIYHNIFPDKYRLSEEGKFVESYLLGRLNLNKGSTATLFERKDINGATISLKDYRDNKYVLLNFWASWCVPCLKEMPTLREIHQKYSQEVEMISISYDTDYTKCLETVDREKMVWKNIFNDVGLINAYGGHLAIPRTYLIDKTGKIIYEAGEDDSTDITLPNLQKILRELFSK